MIIKRRIKFICIVRYAMSKEVVKPNSNIKVVSVILSTIAGALILIGSLIPLLWAYYMPMQMGRGMMGMNMLSPLASPIAYTSITIGVVSSIVIIVSALMLANNPSSYLGVLIIASSIVSLFTMGGFIIGAILGIVGGALALTIKEKASTKEGLPSH